MAVENRRPRRGSRHALPRSAAANIGWPGFREYRMADDA
ncbi:hypothetical protein M527_10775 [Sphingobium indicum IP26]|nr:hypothetical protein M527_10775 [Sphingobium indicum IP26]EQA99859.1 hypothetical protein L286_18490 [Sphingobium sp. HDIP04]